MDSFVIHVITFVWIAGKRIQEIVSIVSCTTLFVLNGVALAARAEVGHLPTILVAAFFGILAADFLSGYKITFVYFYYVFS